MAIPAAVATGFSHRLQVPRPIEAVVVAALRKATETPWEQVAQVVVAPGRLLLQTEPQEQLTPEAAGAGHTTIRVERGAPGAPV